MTESELYPFYILYTILTVSLSCFINCFIKLLVLLLTPTGIRFGLISAG